MQLISLQDQELRPPVAGVSFATTSTRARRDDTAEDGPVYEARGSGGSRRARST